jgi:hypothetical protein
MTDTSRRRFLALAALAPFALGCRGREFGILGYRAGADVLYDPNIRTVYVPNFNNRALQTNPYRGFENDVTQAVIREIGKTTPFRVTSDYTKADTELLGNVVQITTTILNRNQQNLTREAEITVFVDVVWRDLRDGKVLSNPRPRPEPGRMQPGLPTEVPPPFDPSRPVAPEVRDPDLPQPVRIVATGRVLPELGETNASASKAIHDKLAVQIVSLMERKW